MVRLGPLRTLILSLLALLPLVVSCSDVRPALVSSGVERLSSAMPAGPALAESLDQGSRSVFESPKLAFDPRSLTLGWGETLQATDVWPESSRSGTKRGALPAGSRVEVLDGAGGGLLIRFPGDARGNPPAKGWVEAKSLGRMVTPDPESLPWGYPASTDPSVVRLKVPYYSQLDGSSWAEANCGPTSLSMALGMYGIEMPSWMLRPEVLNAQGMWGDEAGTLLDALARVAEAHVIRVEGLYDGDQFHRWSVGEVHDQLEHGHPVIAQVRYRVLPEREGSLYWGDHYIVLTGVAGDRFLYNDPIDADGVGYDRIMSASTLAAAMDTSDRRYTSTAFALAK